MPRIGDQSQGAGVEQLRCKAVTWLASIPSPDINGFALGPLRVNIYGVCIAVGVVAAYWIARRRWEARGYDGNQISEVVLWIVGAGVVGARVYHLFTGYRWNDGGLLGTVKIWEGGLSIWGAVLGGAVAVIVLSRVKHLDALALMDAITPGLAVAQGIGRWGNYFNQELFGKPTELPWGLEISLDRRPLGYENFTTFHPTFLYESLWCFAVAGIIVMLGRQFRLRKGQSFAAYLFLYPLGRFFFENLRIDKSEFILGLRFNAWVAIAVGVFGAGWFFWLARRGNEYPEGYPLKRLPQVERGEPEVPLGAGVEPGRRSGEDGPEVPTPDA